MLAGLRQGVKIVTMSMFDPELYLNIIQTHKVKCTIFKMLKLF